MKPKIFFCWFDKDFLEFWIKNFPKIKIKENNIENKVLYFKLKLDLVAKYFSEYPETSTDNLIAFQIELRNYVREHGAEVEIIKEAV